MFDAINILRPVAHRSAQGCCTVAVALGLILSNATVHARDTGQLRDVSPELTGWLNKQTDQLGIYCGGTAGALRPQAVTWNDNANFFRAKVGNKWVFVPDEAILNSLNPFGDAVVPACQFKILG